MMKSLLPDDVEANNTTDDIRLRSNFFANKTIRFTNISFSYWTLGLTQSPSGPLGDIEGFVQLIPGTYKSVKPNNNIGLGNLKFDCNNGTVVNCVREHVLWNFALDKLPGLKINKQPKIKHIKRIYKSVLSLTTFHLEDDDHKTVDYYGETISFTNQFIKF